MGSQNEINMAAILIGALIAGGLSGLLPLLVGISKKQEGLAIAGMIACIVSGLILGLLLAVPVALVFLFIILAASNAREKEEMAASADRNRGSSCLDALQARRSQEESIHRGELDGGVRSGPRRDS
jgi:hypothetical protein